MIFNSKDVISVFSRRPQNMSFNHGVVKDSLNSRRDFLAGYGIRSADLVCAKQIHGTNVKYAAREDKGCGALKSENAIPATDALITNEPDLPLAVFTADCFPVFLYDPLNKAIGIVHSGWRGTKEGIVIKTARLMAEKFATAPGELRAGLGPGIRECCYEVGQEFEDYFAKGLIQRQNHYYLDLGEIIKEQLTGLGIKQEHIFDSGICTFCRNEEFFSYRKQGVSCGRIMSVIMLKKNA